MKFFYLILSGIVIASCTNNSKGLNISEDTSNTDKESMTTCIICNGAGHGVFFVYDETCPICKGSGQVPQKDIDEYYQLIQQNTPVNQDNVEQVQLEIERLEARVASINESLSYMNEPTIARQNLEQERIRIQYRIKKLRSMLQFR